jgi:hypothetical protein
MTKFLNKDERAALIAEFDQGLPPSNPDFYVKKNKNGVYNVRQTKLKKQPTEETVTDYSDAVKLAMSTIESELGTGSVRVKKPQSAREPVILSDEAKAALKLIEEQTGCKVRVPKTRPIPVEQIATSITPVPVNPRIGREGGFSFAEKRQLIKNNDPKPKAL